MNTFKIGLQLYSVREEMARDMEGTLRAVKDMGYDYVEFAGCFGRSAGEVRSLLDHLGLACMSVHQSYEVFLEDGPAHVAFIRTLGARYCAVPWMGKEKHKGSSAFVKTLEELEQVGALLKREGITLLYHNHEFEFERAEGKFLLDWLYDSLPADLLQTEIDTCWVKYAGYNPAEYLLRCTGRSPVVHLKDFVCTELAAGAAYALIDDAGKEIKTKKSKEDNGFRFKPLGQGIQDIPSIVEAARAAGAEYLVVEQDQSPELPPLESVRQSRKYLRTLGL